MGFLFAVRSVRHLQYRQGLFRRKFSTDTLPDETNILVVGGGVVGSAICDLLSSRLPELSIGLVDATKAMPPMSSSDTIPHPRSYALSPASLSLLNLQQTPQGPYNTMQVWEANQSAYLSFSLQDLPLDSSNQSSSNISCLGACVEDGAVVHELQSRLLGENGHPKKNVTILRDTKVTDVKVPPRAAEGLCKVTLQTGGEEKKEERTVQTQLLIAADGANSGIRKQLGIASTSWDYGQTALTFTVQLAGSMQGRAFQRFLPTGPLALLPTHSDQHAVVVWSTTPELADYWKSQDDNEGLAQHINSLLQKGPERLEPLLPLQTTDNMPLLGNLMYGAEKIVETLQYGPAMAAASAGTPPQADDNSSSPSSNSALFVTPPSCTTVASARFAFPLQCRQVTKYTAPRVALAGDAAHTMHPMAGQGLNLGLQDVEALVAVIEKAEESGMDPATFLQQYEQGRHAQVTATVQGVHALHTVFGQQSGLAKHAKSLGMNLVQNVKPLRSLLVQAACQGVVGGAKSD